MTTPLHLTKRPRRLRRTAALRELVRENRLHPANFILPLFVSEKTAAREPVPSMPGVCQLGLEAAVAEARDAFADGVRSVLLFGIPAVKDEQASRAYAADGIVQRAVAALKRELPELVVITDVCLCGYTRHGHCGVVQDGEVVNDASVALLASTAVSHAASGADMVAPSDMMDGRVGAIRAALDQAGFGHTPIMSYAAKFASAFYGPFRDAAESAPQFGDRRSYQLDPANGDEAVREVALDVAEGADLVMVKPGLPCLDVVRRVKEAFHMPTAVYCVSGEFAAVRAAAQHGWLDEKAVVLEMMTACKRAGADLIATYWARDIVRWLGG